MKICPTCGFLSNCRNDCPNCASLLVPHSSNARKIAELQDKLDKAISVGNRLAAAAAHLGWTGAERYDVIEDGQTAVKAWAELGYENHHTP